MLLNRKKERFYLKNKNKITMLLFSMLSLVFSVLGYPSAFNEEISGLLICSGKFRFFWSCCIIPLTMAVVPFIVGNTRKMLNIVIVSKAVATLIGLSFGINLNIHLPVFQDDWGVLFFLSVDVFIGVTIYNERYERLHIKGACVIALALMAISTIIYIHEGDLVQYYIFRSLYIITFYISIYFVICNITPRYWNFPNSHEEKRLKRKFAEMSLEE